MPYEYNPEDENNNEQNSPPPPPPPQPSSGVTPASTAGSGESPFINLQKYLQVNEDQAGALGGKVANPIEQEAQSAKDKAATAQGNFQQQVQQNTVSTPTFLNQLSEGSNLPSDYSGTKPLGAAGLNPSQKDEIAKARQANYGGPIDFNGYLDEARASQQKANEQAELSKTNPGQFSLLQQFVNDPNYKRGQTRLDQALLSGSSEAQDRLSQARGKVGEVEGDFQNKITSANQAAAQGKSTTEAAKNATNEGLQQASSAYLNRLQQDAAGKNQQRLGQEQAYQNILKGLGTPGQYQSLGLGAYAGKNLYGVDASKYYQGADTNLDANDVANDYQRAQLSALQQLQGQENPYLQDPTVKERSFDVGGFKNDLTAAENNYNKESAQKLNDAMTSISPNLTAANRVYSSVSDLKSQRPMVTTKSYIELPDGRALFLNGNETPAERSKYQSAINSIYSDLHKKYGGKFNVIDGSTGAGPVVSK